MRKREVQEELSGQPVQVDEPKTSFYSPSKSAYDASDWPQPPTDTSSDSSKPVNWSASEDTSQKTPLWYLALVLVGLIATATVAFFTRDVVSSVTVFIAFLLLTIFTARKPSAQEYAVHDGQLAVGAKQYSLHGFKAFSIDEHQNHLQIILIPLKRFMPTLVVPLDYAVADDVVDALADMLPLQPYKPDFVDVLIRRLRL